MSTTKRQVFQLKKIPRPVGGAISLALLAANRPETCRQLPSLRRGTGRVRRSRDLKVSERLRHLSHPTYPMPRVPPCIAGVELQVRTPNCTALHAASDDPKDLTVSLGPEEVSFWEFVQQGWRRETASPGSGSASLVAENGWSSKSAPALRFRPTQLSRWVCNIAGLEY